jgi:hypothetical protein
MAKMKVNMRVQTLGREGCGSARRVVKHDGVVDVVSMAQFECRLLLSEGLSMVDGRNLEERACDGRTGLCWNEGFRYRERHYDGSARAWAGGSGRISRDLLIRPEDPRCQTEGDRDAGGYCSQWSLVWFFPPAFAVWVYRAPCFCSC